MKININLLINTKCLYQQYLKKKLNEENVERDFSKRNSLNNILYAK